MIMVRNLKKAGREERAASVKRDFKEYVDDPEEFLEEVEKKYGRAAPPPPGSYNCLVTFVESIMSLFLLSVRTSKVVHILFS